MEKKKRLRDMSWDDYGISKNRYKELKAFCLQYDEKKSKVKYGISAMKYDGMPKGNSVGSGVESQAIRNNLFKQECAMIEMAAMQANPEIWKYILKSVTMGLPFEFIEYDDELGRITVGKTDFYGYRKLFFHYLDRLKVGDKLSEVS